MTSGSCKAPPAPDHAGGFLYPAIFLLKPKIRFDAKKFAQK